jgi:hypothetical protein
MSKSDEKPVRICVRFASGKRRMWKTGYDAIKRYRALGQLIGAWSTSTGKVLA